MQAKIYITTTLMLLGLCGIAFAAAENPHEITVQSQSVDCTSCHLEQPAHSKAEILETKNHQAEREAYKIDGVEMCSSCHNPDDGHKVGLKLDFEIPADMPLGTKNKLTCLTCHYTHGKLASDRPQASVSFMDRMLDAERLHKSFLLRRNNADGELCLTCHNVNGGSK